MAWDKNQFCSWRNWGKKHEFAWKNYVPQKVINFSSLNAYAKLNLPGNEKRITIKKIRNWYSISCYTFDKSSGHHIYIYMFIYIKGGGLYFMHLIIKHSNQSFNHFKPVTNFILCVYRVLKSIRLFYGNTCVWRLSWDIQITVITIWGKWCAFCIDVRRKISSIALIYFMVVYKWFCNDPKLISKLEMWKDLLNMLSIYI